MTTQIAVAATDSVPIVKQILGVVARIVALAEKFEKDRDAVHSLAQKAKMMTDTIEAAVPKANPDGNLLISLEHLHTVLSSIQKWLEKHTAKPRFLKILSYLLTVSKDLDRLNQDLNTALSLFHLSAQIEASARKRFCEIPDCNIDKLDLITEYADEDEPYTVKYCSARIEGLGRLYVVRYFEGNKRSNVDVRPGGMTYLQRRLAEHDEILEDISTFHKSHQNVARLYGQGLSSGDNQFTVMKSGYIPIDNSNLPRHWTLSTVINIASQVLDPLRAGRALPDGRVPRGPDASPLWNGPVLRCLELTLAPAPGQLVLCDNISAFLASTLRAPAVAELVLRGVALMERPGNGAYEWLLRCVSRVRALDAPEPLGADRAWSGCKIDKDRSRP
ncbi:hypothetical protein AURDEDRAFT_171303 [Auricularia subglabra TFB-10046 SS5]|nr:hypothetical protein AURDEDRAFT_171303 [Auricularia subglabra TFB-10046 SS5]